MTLDPKIVAEIDTLCDQFRQSLEALATEIANEVVNTMQTAFSKADGSVGIDLGKISPLLKDWPPSQKTLQTLAKSVVGDKGQSAAAPVKRGPGRPRKNPAIEVVDATKRKPGRPKKVEAAAPTKNGKAKKNGASANGAAPKKRGRPPKAVTSPAVATPPKKRGRPPGSKNKPKAAPSTASAEDSAPAPVDEVVEEITMTAAEIAADTGGNTEDAKITNDVQTTADIQRLARRDRIVALAANSSGQVRPAPGTRCPRCRRIAPKSPGYCALCNPAPEGEYDDDADADVGAPDAETDDIGTMAEPDENLSMLKDVDGDDSRGWSSTWAEPEPDDDRDDDDVQVAHDDTGAQTEMIAAEAPSGIEYEEP